MNKNEQNGLRRLDIDNILPTGFDDLTGEEQNSIVKQLRDQDIEMRRELLSRAGKSKIAEHDIAVGIETIQRLDHDKKIYSKKMKGETGSGTYEIDIKGGDTKFIVPVLIIFSVLTLGVVAMFVLR
ncbi:MAG: hypothetical protein MI863_00245 [Desulfobacterales bacterium]|nr:hypothetical protein [Desulfobacterales bacterium]